MNFDCSYQNDSLLNKRRYFDSVIIKHIPTIYLNNIFKQTIQTSITIKDSAFPTVGRNF